MSCWHLLWMLVTVLGIFVLVGHLPFAWLRIVDAEEDARFRLYFWWGERRRRREIERYGQPLEACLYCGSQCEFGPGCFNRHLAPKAVTS